ncbi:MAG TPA: tyrosine-protein phosphatase, partial [Bellilinea sp.]|nr:tyrosine-protein phosphatase [Bellilinea sp.]
MNKAKFLAELDRKYRFFRNAYAGLTVSQLLQPGVSGDWSVKDIIGHVADWEAEMLRRAPILLGQAEGESYLPQYNSADVFNAQMTAEHSSWDLPQALRHQALAHSALMAFLDEVPPHRFDGRTRFMKHLRGNTADHYVEHGKAIRGWRRQQNDPNSRIFDWAGFANARELGGFPLPGGGSTLAKRFIRADSTGKLDPEGLQELQDYGVTLVIDLRSDLELGEEPAPFAAGGAVQYRQVPFFSDVSDYIAKLEAAADYGDGYCIMVDNCKSSVADILRTVVEHDGTVLYHCAAGKDRTGLISMMLLSLAGVSDEDIA